MTYDLDAAIRDMLKPKPGWIGHFTTMSAPGAMPPGTRIAKAVSEAGDAHQAGAPGTVLGSIIHPDKGVAYFIEWDDMPRRAVLVMALKVMADQGVA